jgi:hypothetical protein
LASKRREVEALVAGLDELLDLLDRTYVPVEQAINRTIDQLTKLFPFGMTLEKRQPLGMAAGGLVSILNAANDNPGDREMVKLLEKRAKALSLIRAGVTELEPSAERLTPRTIREAARDPRSANHLESIRIEERTITTVRQSDLGPDWEPYVWTYTVPLIKVPETRPILSIPTGEV